ncbi:MAG: hypothetical protein AAF196_13305 [Planctomycetota bacterium]
MSTIGRIFVVLNLLLSGGFLYFAGVHLTNQTDLQQTLETEREERSQREDKLSSDLQSAQDKLADATNGLTATEGLLNAAANERDQLKDANETLQSTLQQINGQVTSMSSSWNQIQGKLESVEQQLTRTRETASTSEQERNEAVREKNEAVAELADVRQDLSNTEADKASLQSTYEDTVQTLQERELLIEALRQRLVAAGIDPGVSNLVPALSGSVIRVEPSGNYLTLRVQEGDQPVQVGYTFSIASGGRLKAVATVSEVYTNGAAFCTFRTVSGSAGPEVGDEAFTRR